MPAMKYITVRDQVLTLRGIPRRTIVWNMETGEAKTKGEPCEVCGRDTEFETRVATTIDVLKDLVTQLPVEVKYRDDSMHIARWFEALDQAEQSGTVEEVEDGSTHVVGPFDPIVIAEGEYVWLFGADGKVGVLDRKLPEKSRRLVDTSDFAEKRWTVAMTLWGDDADKIRQQVRARPRSEQHAIDQPAAEEDARSGPSPEEAGEADTHRHVGATAPRLREEAEEEATQEVATEAVDERADHTGATPPPVRDGR